MSEEIVWPKKTHVNSFEGEAREVLEAIGARGAWASDESKVEDFWALDRVEVDGQFVADDEKFEERIRKAGQKLGIEISAEDKIYELASRLYQRRKN